MLETIFRLRGVGIEVEVLAPSYRGSRDSTFQGIPVHRFRYAPSSLERLTHDETVPDRLRRNPLWALLLPGYLLGGVLAARRLARSGRFDAFHAFWPVPHSVIGHLGRLSTEIPLVSTFFGVELTWVRRDLPFLASLVRWIARASDAVTAISSYTAGLVRAFAPDVPIEVIPFGAATQSPTALPRNHSKVASDGAFQLLFIGRLVERKGVRNLLEAVAELEPEVVLTVAGDGPLGPELRELAASLGVAERVRFTGFVSEEELARELEGSDVLVLPAVEDAKGDVEGLGVVLLEAMQAGKPVIASRSGGITDIVIDRETGLLVEPGDSRALADAVRQLRDDPELRRALVAGGQQHLSRNFSWDSIVAHLEKIYQSVVKSNSHNRMHGSVER